MQDNIYNPEYVKELFDKMSSSYERMNYITSFGFSLRWRRQFLNSISCCQDEVQVIDLLSGMGETWTATKERLPKGKITAIDFSEGMLAYAERKNRNKFNNEVSVVHQDILNNTLPDNYYDYLICAFGLKTFNTEQLKVLASETRRILKPGGQFSFVEVSKPENKVLQSLYGFYLGKLIPVLGKLFLGGPAEYKLLWKYTAEFGNSTVAAEIFCAEGLEVQYKSYFYGCASGFNGRKV